MSHPKAVMWGVIVCFAVIIGVIYYLSTVGFTPEWSPPADIQPAPVTRPSPEQTNQMLDSLKATSTTKANTAQQQRSVNSLKGSSTSSKSSTTTKATSSAETNTTLDALKGH